MLEPFAHSPLGKASSRETSVNEPSSPMPKDSWKSGLLKAAIKREKNLTGLQPLRDLAIQIDCIVQLTFLDARAVCAFPSRESIEPRDECERAVLSDAEGSVEERPFKAAKTRKKSTGLQPLCNLAIQIDRIVQLTFLDELALRMRDVNRSRTDQQSFAPLRQLRNIGCKLRDHRR
jgi:hypothetical protein